MVIDEMGGKIKIMIKKNQSNIGEAIDTDAECEPVATIPEAKLKLRSQKTQEDIDQAMEAPPEKISMRGDVLT